MHLMGELWHWGIWSLILCQDRWPLEGYVSSSNILWVCAWDVSFDFSHVLLCFVLVGISELTSILWHVSSQSIFCAAVILRLLEKCFLVHLLAEEIFGIEWTHTLHDDFICQHRTIDFAAEITSSLCCQLMDIAATCSHCGLSWNICANTCEIEITLRITIDEQALPHPTRTCHLRIEFLEPQLLCALIDLPRNMCLHLYLCSRCMSIPSESLFLWLGGLWPLISVYLSAFVGTCGGQVLRE